jgi:phytoene dehydrogenase-like protein
MGMRTNPDIIIGGGLGGLTCALLLARAGRRVMLFEKASEVGGRAATSDEEGVRLNLGPHALYRDGAARLALRALGVDPAGGRPPASGMLALDRGRLHALPVGFTSLTTTSLLGLAEKVEAARLLQGLARVDPGALGDLSVTGWIDGAARRPGTRRLLHALVRVTTYAHAPDLCAAGETVAQLQRGLGTGVMYVDGGWQTIVSQLESLAVAAGAVIQRSTRVAAVAPGRVTLADGRALAAGSVIVAASPAVAAALSPSSASLAAAARDAVPVHAACLDLALRSLPRPRATFCLGIDEPVYYSVHSAAAALAPGGTQVVHVARYLAPGEKADSSSLESLLDRVQPGWRERVVTSRFMPRLVVANDIHPVGRRRPGPSVSDAPGLFVVGDWVGDGAMLADSVVASARGAVSCILGAQASRRHAPPVEAAAWS